jgi:hypothetical protein
MVDSGMDHLYWPDSRPARVLAFLVYAGALVIAFLIAREVSGWLGSTGIRPLTGWIFEVFGERGLHFTGLAFMAGLLSLLVYGRMKSRAS